ncbi:MAG: low molecular weight phosphotyrosine protein phosphatase [Rhodothermaceae bacterium]|nr:low molecular weight phosphotyrosine protein phosphatase [Rhodothermaceae bacterium]MXX59319.1 low molecular weight phosphotyrosine protein phosphatase [Rhodothermaceae bacterium]MYD20587.1 low molecular weight phosphotyrosine protein phosphatase [Rhodothermaceae bacterium]MYD56204.1 low molecular weight phosphotyrosine protein phosphatase [Rhodothermaceae bacterium]MYI42759.1 low molecular weight phosphotyrosine protein phosphatase [Rhodothermaceae bacterium]
MLSSSKKPKRIMFVCLGNHCRSPLAHGYFQNLVEKHGLQDEIEVASSGTSGWHIGEAPDSRICWVARRHGVRLNHIRGQKITKADLRTCDLILVMDRSNLRDVLLLDRDGRFTEKVRLLRTFDPSSVDDEIPDPYYSGIFEEVYTIVSRACDSLLEEIKSSLGAPTG